MREVARGDKPYLRKSTDRKAQIRKAFVQFSGLICACFAICRFSQVRFITPSHLTHAQSLFLFPIVFGINNIMGSTNCQTRKSPPYEQCLQPPAVTLGRAVATTRTDRFVSLLKVSRLLGDSRSSDGTHYQKDTRPWHDIGEGGGRVVPSFPVY